MHCTSDWSSRREDRIKMAMEWCFGSSSLSAVCHRDVKSIRLLTFLLLSVIGQFSDVLAKAGTPYPFVTTDARRAASRQYDYIVVGGGTAGCAIAATLSMKFSVLVVERGGSPYGVSSIKNAKNLFQTLSRTNRYTSPGQTFVSEDGIPSIRGRVLGGNSALNFGFYSRASVPYIVSMGWNETLVIESYKWVERAVVSNPNLKTWQSALMNSLLEIGMLPYNGYTFDHVTGTKKSGTTFDNNDRRHTSADLLKYANPENVVVLLRATAKRVTFHRKENCRHFSSKPRVRGLEFIDANGDSYEAFLKPSEFFCRLKGRCSEVILCAGALGSPQLLLLSGVGPAEHLKAFNIPLILDLPGVGKGMVDNPRCNISLLSRQPMEFSAPQIVGIAENDESYIEGFSIEQQISASAANYSGTLKQQKVYIGYIAEKVAYPLSSGELFLKTTDPRDNPSVRFNYFSNPLDLAVCIRSMRRIGSLLQTETLRSLVYTNDSAIPTDLRDAATQLMGEALPENILDDGAMGEFCKRTLETIWHYHGGCRIGFVVNNNYQVIGIEDENLRVVDASTFFASPGTNPQATIMMLGRYMGVQILRERMDVGPK